MIFGVETSEKAFFNSDLSYFLKSSVFIVFLSEIVFLICWVAFFTSFALVIAPPTITILAPALTISAAVSLLIPPATAIGIFVFFTRSVSISSGFFKN